MKLTLEILRFSPEKDEHPYYQQYTVEAEPSDRLLSVLMRIKRNDDPTLAFRKSCAHGVCGSDAMIVNGKERLACKTLIKDIAERGKATIRIAPLTSFPVQRDLMVDQTRFFAKFKQIKPYFIGSDPPGKKEQIQTQEERLKFDEATNCILCGSCYSACPVIQTENPDFLGPAALVQASRFNDDSRDEGFLERISMLDKPNGIWPCNNYFQCTKVCPRNIRITKLINQAKRKIKNQVSKN
jgi:succinate dehydrogenase / fumarate reductase iron-sulfur subunit